MPIVGTGATAAMAEVATAAELLVAGGTVVTLGGPSRADVLIGADGLIARIGPDLPAGGTAMLDASGMLVLPGVVDVHSHLRLPTPEAPRRFLQDTVAAAFGGTTTVLTFNNPGTGISDRGARSLLAGLAEFRERVAGQAAVDIGLSAVVTGQQDDPLGELPALIDAGVPTFKAFMVYDFRLPEDALERAMGVAARHGGMLQVHCEDPALIDPLVAEALARGEVGCRHHMLTRPPQAEGAATRTAIELARRADAALYVVHLSCAEALDAVAEAKSRGEPVYAETCPHYLALTDRLYQTDDEAEVIKRVISPPLRSQTDVDALWQGLRDGILDTVASDHVPDRVAVEKRVPAPPFPRISNGAPGIETLLRVVYSEGVAAGRLPLERLVEVLATTPARLFGMPDRGAIEVGRRGDLVVFDPDARRVVRQDDLHHTSDFTPYEGLEVAGAVRATVLAGHRLGTDESGPLGRFVERRLP